ncbi:MAG: hypothetical protein ACPGRW_06000 [Flavobacteriaceae bacterium]
MITIKKAVDHFVFKFKNVWKPTNKDIDALKSIMSFADDTYKNQINDYQLFAKLYVHLYGMMLIHYNATPMNSIPQTELNRIVDTPLETLIKDFTNKANMMELYNQGENLGLSNKYLKTPLEQENDLEILSNNIGLLNNKWTQEDIEKNITTLINHAIRAYK